MKRLIPIFIGIIFTTLLYGQQLPLSENYFLDKYSLSSSYAGNFNNKYLFMGYRSDWSGMEGGPKTLRLSYNDSYKQNMGYGGKFIYDIAGIFKQTVLLGSYSYKVKISENQLIMFGLSAGFYDHTLNLKDIYDDPRYNIDPALISSNITSKLRFMSDFSAVYSFRRVEAGLQFSNINFGDASYREVSFRYNALANYQIHATCSYSLSDKWDLSPIMVLRGGKYIRSQFEIASQMAFQKRVWGSLMFRQSGIFGIGLGANINNNIKIGYNFNVATSVSARYFNNHEISLGINIFELTKQRGEIVPANGEQLTK